MTIKEFVTERTNTFYQAYFKLQDKVHECKGKSIDDVPETIYVEFDDGKYELGCYHLTGWSIWDNSNKDSDALYWQKGPSCVSFCIMNDMLWTFIQYCYDCDDRYKDLDEEDL